MNVKNVIFDSLINYDAAKPAIDYLLENTRDEVITSTSDMKRSVIKFFNKKTDELVLESEFEILGVYYNKYNIWYWGWAMPTNFKSETFISKELLLYAANLDYSFAYIKMLLCTSRSVISDQTQIDINIAVSSDIIKKPYIYPSYTIEGDLELVYYIILINNEKLDELLKSIKKNKSFSGL